MNDYVFPIVIIPLFFSIFIFCRIVTVFFHELGHAIPALIFSKQSVKIFLGTYGDEMVSKKITITGKLEIYIRINLLKWNGAMVVHDNANLTTAEEFSILALGPLFSFFIGTIACWFIFSYDLNGFYKLVSVFFLFSALIDLRNLYPRKKAILLSYGDQTYNDGYQLWMLLKYKKDKSLLKRAYNYYNQNNYKSAIKLFEIINPSYVNNSILIVVLNAFHSVKDYTGGIRYHNRIIGLGGITCENAEVLNALGLFYSFLGDDKYAIDYYNKAIEINPKNADALSNRGYTYNLLENYEDAIIDFSSVIEMGKNISYAMANRGYSKIKLKLIDDGVTDINQAIDVDGENSYAYRNLGLYYLEIGKHADAIGNLKIAYELNPDTHLLVNYLEIAQKGADANC